MLDSAPSDPGDLRPTVPLPSSGVPTPLVIGGFALGALLLFAVLEARRHSAVQPQPTLARSQGLIQSPPPLQLPIEPPAALPAPAVVVPPRVVIQREPAPPAAPPRVIYMPSPTQSPIASPVGPSPSRSNDSGLVVDVSSSDTSTAPSSQATGGSGIVQAGGASGDNGGRVRASFFRNRATTVPQGTLIPAVLETAFDSSRPGLARAIVSEDARGFDGSRVLIPRGSRLVGEYKADAAQGQRRAVITWTRLVRPDGATIAIGSPSGDTLGRGGITGHVDTHFLERFGGAILQSALDIGVNVASSRIARGNVILGIPNQLGGAATGIFQPQQIPPTIKVRQGTAITIFVARDLDFTPVERRP